MTTQVHSYKLFKPSQLHNSTKTAWIPFGTRKLEADFRSLQRQSCFIHVTISPSVTVAQMSTQKIIFVLIIYGLMYTHTYAKNSSFISCLIFSLHYLRIIFKLQNCLSYMSLCWLRKGVGSNMVSWKDSQDYSQ